MATDPNILLAGIKPVDTSKGLDIGGAMKDYYGLRNMIQTEKTKEMQYNDALAVKDIYANADLTTPEGKSQLVAALYKVSPTAAAAQIKADTESRKTEAEIGEKKAMMLKHVGEFDAKKVETSLKKVEAVGSAMTQFRGLMESKQADGTPIPDAVLQSEYERQVMSLIASGALTKDEANTMMPREFNRQVIVGLTENNKAFQEVLKQRADVLKVHADTEQSKAKTVEIGVDTKNKAEEGKFIAPKAEAEIGQKKASAASSYASANASNASASKTREEAKYVGRLAEAEIGSREATAAKTRAEAGSTIGGVKLESGYRWVVGADGKPTGEQEPVPGGSKDDDGNARRAKLASFKHIVPQLRDAITLLEQDPTGSGAGNAIDKAAAFVGITTSSSKPAAALAQISANVVLTLPRMGGATSDADLLFLKQAAADLGNPTISVAVKAAAARQMLKGIEDYQAGKPVDRTGMNAPKSEDIKRLDKLVGDTKSDSTTQLKTKGTSPAKQEAGVTNSGWDK